MSSVIFSFIFERISTPFYKFHFKESEKLLVWFSILCFTLRIILINNEAQNVIIYNNIQMLIHFPNPIKRNQYLQAINQKAHSISQIFSAIF